MPRIAIITRICHRTPQASSHQQRHFSCSQDQSETMVWMSMPCVSCSCSATSHRYARFQQYCACSTYGCIVCMQKSTIAVVGYHTRCIFDGCVYLLHVVHKVLYSVQIKLAVTVMVLQTTFLSFLSCVCIFNMSKFTPEWCSTEP